MLIRIEKLELEATFKGANPALTVARKIRAYVNPQLITSIMFAPDGFEGLACIQCDGLEHWVREAEADALVEHINQTPAPAASAPASAPLHKTVEILSMTRDKTKNSGSPMWRCGTSEGFTVNVFKHDDPLKDTFNLFDHAGYAPEMVNLNYGDTLTWTRDSISVEIQQNGAFWNVVSVLERPDGALPDEPEPEEIDLESAGYDGMGGAPWEGSTEDDE